LKVIIETKFRIIEENIIIKEMGLSTF